MSSLPSSKPSTEIFELVPLACGVNSLRSQANGQTFHPVVGPVAEARAVHVEGPKLVERANAHVPKREGDPFTIWDVGLGAAANALTAVAALTAGYRGDEDVSLLSFDRSLDAFRFALANHEALAYPGAYLPAMQTVCEDETAVFSLPLSDRRACLSWTAFLGDFPTRLASVAHPAPHAIFYDPYSPTVNPEMWTLETFTALFACTRPDTPCLLTTYTRSTAVRVTLLLAGWFVGIGGATGEKDETSVASNDPALLDRPLGRGWLEKKVYASTNAAPLLDRSAHTRGPISEADFARLRAHPQMSAG